MKINTEILHDDEGPSIVITECYNGVLLRTRDGLELGICMRDDGFEVSLGKGKYPEDYNSFCINPRGIASLDQKTWYFSCAGKGVSDD